MDVKKLVEKPNKFFGKNQAARMCN